MSSVAFWHGFRTDTLHPCLVIVGTFDLYVESQLTNEILHLSTEVRGRVTATSFVLNVSSGKLQYRIKGKTS